MKALAELDQYINQHFTLACEMFSIAGKWWSWGWEGIRPYPDPGKVSRHVREYRHSSFGPSGRSRARRFGDGYAAGCGYRYLQLRRRSGDRGALIPVLKRLRIAVNLHYRATGSSMARAADVICVLKVLKEACPLGWRLPVVPPQRAGDGRRARRGVVKRARLYRRGFRSVASAARWT